MARTESASSTKTPSVPRVDDINARLLEAFPEVNFEAMGERLRPLGGSHNLEEKWAAIVREISSFLELTKVTQ